MRAAMTSGRAVTVAATLLSGLTPVSAVVAADWQFIPRVELDAVYDDNYRMTEVRGEETEVFGALANLQLGIRAATPTTIFTLTPQLASAYFPDDDDENSNDALLAARWQYAGQRINSDVQANYSHETVIRSELPDAAVDGDLGEPVDGQISRITVRNKRDQLRLAPRMSFELSERLNLDVTAGYTDVSYDRTVIRQQQGYENLAGGLGLGFASSRTSTLSFIGSVAEYKPDDLPGGLTSAGDTRTYGLTADWTNRISERQRVYVRGGAKRTEFDRAAGSAPGLDDSVTSYIGGAGTSWQFQVTNLFLDVARDVQPNSTGEVVNRDDLRLRLTRAFSPRWSAVVGARGVRSKSVDREGVRDDRKYVTGTVGFEWRLRPQIAVTGDYEYSWQEFSQDPTDAKSNAVTLGVVYQPEVRR